MNVLQYFFGTKLNGDVSPTPMFNLGDEVRLKHYPEDVRLLYNKYYPTCALDVEQWKAAWDNIAEKLGYGPHTVTQVRLGTPACGGWWVYVDGENEWGFHGNIFELVKEETK